jgi:hypothetical protein
MADTLFTFKTPLVQTDVTIAISQVEEKNWNKRKDVAEKAQQAFTEEKPTLESIQKRFEGKSAEETLMSYATNSRVTMLPDQTQTLSTDEAKMLGAVLLQVEKNSEAPNKAHPGVSIKGSDGKELQLEPKELSAWLQANAKEGKNIPANEWASSNQIGLTSHGDFVANGNETLYIETRDGQRRVVGNGNLSEPINGHYGAIRGLKVGDGDDVDVFVTNDIMKDIKGRGPYEGKVFVMQQMDKGKPDELKLGFAQSADEFKAIMTSTWKDGKDFEKLNEGKYAELTLEQYKQLKTEIAQNPTLTLDEFVKDKNIKTQEFTKIAALETGQDKVKTASVDPQQGNTEAVAMTMNAPPEKPLSSLSSDVLKLAVAAIDKGVTQFHQVAMADRASSKTPVVPEIKGDRNLA